MFASVLAELVARSETVTRRADGVAFFRALKELYDLAGMTYVCVNIPVQARAKRYAHYLLSDSAVVHCAGQSLISPDFIDQAMAEESPRPTDRLHNAAGSTERGDHGAPTFTFSFPERVGETAIFRIVANAPKSEWAQRRDVLARELHVLASYFHSHVLRINGKDSDQDMLISARELDCLKWTAAGKTAWEASVILGISERTVRFHLNAAREKLDCTTTTQAVAKAVANRLIDV
jgi:DNA-binding CsgD family transcriptional regulator